MSKLPRTEELPHAKDGYDAARVEEAFASFADRVRELESVAGELRAELRALRSERAPARRAPALDHGRFDDEAWPDEHGLEGAAAGPSPEWVASVPAPLVRPLTVPRIALEGFFLLLVALFAGLADLSATWIVLVMAGAWALVAISEWAAAAKRARWRLEDIPAAIPSTGGGAGENTGPWSMPVVHATAVELPEVSESHTVVAQAAAEPELPDAADGAGEERAADPAPKPPRKGFLRRRRAPETAADPWEA